MTHLLIAALAVAQPGTDPRYEKLAERLTEFRSLPAARQDQLRKLDEELNALPRADRDRLRRVLDEYNRWLDALPAEDRRRVTGAATAVERLEAVRDIRLRQAAERLPKKQREEIEKAPETDRPALRDRFLREQRQRRREAALPRWEEAAAVTLPAPFDAAGPRNDLIRYLREVLGPRLDEADQERLWLALFAAPSDRGREFFAAVAELSDRAARALPGPSRGPGHLLELPREAQAALAPHMRQSAKLREELARAPKGWPGFAEAVARIAREHDVRLPKPLGPATAGELSAYPGVKAVLEKAKADPAAADRLRRAEGRWPDYPRAVREEAARLKVEWPGLRPPGPAGFWEGYRPPAGGG